MKKIISLLTLSLISSLSFAQYHPEIETKLEKVRIIVEKEINSNSYDNEIIKINKATSLESMHMMTSIPDYIFTLEESGEDFFKYDVYLPNTEFAVKILSELNNLMTTDSKFWKRKYLLSKKTEIELTENEKKFLGRSSFPRVSMDQNELKKYSMLVNKTSILYESMLKIEKEEIDKLSRTDRKIQETRIGVIEKTWNKQLQDNQDIIANWSKSL